MASITAPKKPRKNSKAGEAVPSDATTVGSAATGTTDSQASQVMGELIEVELDRIKPSPDNPRQFFDETEMRELAESITSLGLLQPLLCGRCDGSFELIAGERRYRASKLVGKTRVPCYVREMTAEEITLARWEENKKRSDLSVIEEARSYQAAIERHGWTQSQLASKLGISQSEVANRMRLLKLPLSWQKKLISREINKLQGLDLVKFAGRDKFFEVLDALQAEYCHNDDRTIERWCDLPAAEWDAAMRNAMCESSLGLRDSILVEQYLYKHFDLSKEPADVLEKLDVQQISLLGEKYERCWNVDLWKEIAIAKHQEQKAKDAKKQAQKDGNSKAKSTSKAAKKEPTAEELKAAEELHNKRLYRHRISWLQSEIATRLDGLDQEDFLILWVGFSLTNGKMRNQTLRDAAVAVGVKPCPGYSEKEVWTWVLELDRGKLTKLLKAFFGEWCKIAARSWSSDANPHAIEGLAKMLSIEHKTWRVTQEFLSFHTVAQLCGLLVEWKLVDKSNGTKADLVKWILEENEHRTLPAPKELINCTPCILD